MHSTSQQLLRGSFQNILKEKETQGLTEELEAFYSQYLHSYDGSLTLFNSIPGLKIFHTVVIIQNSQAEKAIAYMPLDRLSFTLVLSACHAIQDAFPLLGKYMVFWKHFLVASSLNDSQDSFTFYDYLTHPDTGKCDDGLINQVKEKAQVWYK